MMRRPEREIINPNEILRIINNCKVMRIGMCDGDVPYVLPVNFGYEVGYTFYFHSALQGKKSDIMAKNPNVCIEMDTDHELIAGDKACDYSYKYSSIIGMGRAKLICDTAEKIRGINAIMKHQTGKEFSFSEQMLEGFALYAIKVHELKAKSHQPKTSRLTAMTPMPNTNP